DIIKTISRENDICPTVTLQIIMVVEVCTLFGPFHVTGCFRIDRNIRAARYDGGLMAFAGAKRLALFFAIMRVLLSEGSSLTAREFVTTLGPHGHRIEVLDPDPFCLAGCRRKDCE